MRIARMTSVESANFQLLQKVLGEINLGVELDTDTVCNEGDARAAFVWKGDPVTPEAKSIFEECMGKLVKKSPAWKNAIPNAIAVGNRIHPLNPPFNIVELSSPGLRAALQKTEKELKKHFKAYAKDTLGPIVNALEALQALKPSLKAEVGEDATSELMRLLGNIHKEIDAKQKMLKSSRGRD